MKGTKDNPIVQRPLRLDEKDLAHTNLEKDNFIFAGSSTDMFAEDVPTHNIKYVLDKIRMAAGNRYLLQSKNPKRMYQGGWNFPAHVVIGTTIETNRSDPLCKISHAPGINERIIYMDQLRRKGFETMITIEPIMDFDMDEFLERLVFLNPSWINIGADSKGHDLNEPPWEKIAALIEGLRTVRMRVKVKDNLKRLIR